MGAAGSGTSSPQLPLAKEGQLGMTNRGHGKLRGSVPANAPGTSDRDRQSPAPLCDRSGWQLDWSRLWTGNYKHQLANSEGCEENTSLNEKSFNDEKHQYGQRFIGGSRR
ncbi:hypothetical protein UY3_03361 [Chelonia mydas]|uniref:Uncharacterized protein n=1 Tax=Chelonia mydas TaxID=8469 RepID=M7BUD8_CHEMY|nr:hypothetical protein UY3_03361 [Chelonia mydas]